MYSFSCKVLCINVYVFLEKNGIKTEVEAAELIFCLYSEIMACHSFTSIVT